MGKTKDKIIRFRVTEEEYETIKKLTEESKRFSISEYCRTMALTGRIISVDREAFRAIDDCTAKYMERNRLLKGIMMEIHNRCVYYPVDLEIIQNAVDENRKQQTEEYAEIRKLLRGLR